MDDLSGIDVSAETKTAFTMTPGARKLLDFCSRTYFPFLVANAEAVKSKKRVRVTILDGVTHEQPCFKYQLYCLQVLKRAYGHLSARERRFVDGELSPLFVAALLPASRL